MEDLEKYVDSLVEVSIDETGLGGTPTWVEGKLVRHDSAHGTDYILLHDDSRYDGRNLWPPSRLGYKYDWVLESPTLRNNPYWFDGKGTYTIRHRMI
jgi:hypothetical protein